MVVGSGKATDATYVVAVVEEDVVEICIAPKTPGMVLQSEKIFGFPSVPIGITFRGIVEH